MGKPQSFEKPTGFRDFPPPFACKKRLLEERLQKRFSQWGYQEILTPTLEFYDTVGNSSAVSEQRMFKWLDREGKTLVLKPDQTAPIARVVASLFKEERLPLRLSYHSPVFRAQENETGRKAELFQSGIELIGTAGSAADVEVISLAMEAVRTCEIAPFQVAIGHVGLLDVWLSERIDSLEQITSLKKMLEQRNLVGYQQMVEQLTGNRQVREELLAVLRVQQHPADCLIFKQENQSQILQDSYRHLLDIWELLSVLGEEQSIVFDPSLTGNVGYYTGMVFEAYAADNGFPLLSGGRYDELLATFRHPLPATGFALRMDRLLETSALGWTEPEHITIYYQRERQTEAFLQAQQLRAADKRVILKQIDSLSDIPAEDTTFEHVILFEEGS